jgi:hypothetical protein
MCRHSQKGFMTDKTITIDIVEDPPPVEPPKIKKTRRTPKPPPPLKGSFHTIGSESGRRKVWDPEIEAEALYEWLLNPKEITLLKFCLDRGYVWQRCNEWCNNCPKFKEAYNYAKQTIAYRRELLSLTGQIEKSVFHRYQAMYDSQLHAFERGEKSFEIEAKMKLEMQSQVSPENKMRLETLLEQIKLLQAAQSTIEVKPAENIEEIDSHSE